MSNVKKNSLKHVFLSESEEPKTAKNVVNPPMDKAPNTSKTDKNVADLAKKKKVKDVNKELDSYKSILEGPFDDAYETHEKSVEDKKVTDEKEKKKANLTKMDAPFSNNLKECPFDMDSPEHEAMETPEEEAMEHMPGGSEYGEEPMDHIIITVGHNADEEMEKTGQPAFNIGRKFGAPGSPNFKDGIDDGMHNDLDESKKASVEKKSTWQPPKKGVNPFPKKSSEKEEMKEALDPYDMDFEADDDLDIEDNDLDIEDDFVPGSSAYGHSGRHEDYFDNDKESGSSANMSVTDLIEAGYSDEEIMNIVRNTKTQHGLKEVTDSDENITGNTPDNQFKDESEDLTMMQESFNPKRWQRLAGIKECAMQPVLKEMDPFNGFADDPEFDEDGLPIEKDDEDSDEDRMNAFDDEKFARNDMRSDRPGRK